MVARGSKERRKKSARGKGKLRSPRTTRMNRGDAAKKRVTLRPKAGSLFPKGDYETDVLIVGYGAAGANAAIAAHDAGARALVIEKLGFPGGNSGVCAGAMVIPESLEEAIQYYRALSFGTAEEEMIRSFAEEMVNIPRLLTELGIEFKVRRTEPAYFPSFLTGQVKRIQVSPTGADGFRFLQNLVQDRKVEVLMDTPATALIQDPRTREVIGVKARRKGKEITFLARRGVILACGGYEYNRGMIADFHFPGATDYIFPWGTPGNTGDGIKLASEAGAALWHIASIEWGAFCARKPSQKFGTAVGAGLGRAMAEGSFVFVNKYGKRFMPENTSLIHRKAPLEILFFDHERAEYRNLPAYMVFDETYRRRGPVASTREHFQEMWGGPVGYPTVHKIYEWSQDNQAEINQGWMFQADTLAALAGKIGADASALEETVRNFNQACREGRDLQFGRPGKSLAPLETPPYYAVELALTLVNTQGGPKHNKDCQVLDFGNRAIPRLYAAGEVSSFFGFLYQGGNNYPEAWAFGQIAGRKAAAETPWGR
ncbi:MAG TPA: FAD-dependent oxidoreductase [Thermodesulfobacteriota bacterium]|nr:FAD-dependent oxidoreductase [Thermodesulfobacteriota bacterium]